MNERQIIRHYKREHYQLEIVRALRQLEFWLRDETKITDAFSKLRQSYGDIVYYQVLYEFNNKINTKQIKI